MKDWRQTDSCRRYFEFVEVMPTRENDAEGERDSGLRNAISSTRADECEGSVCKLRMFVRSGEVPNRMYVWHCEGGREGVEKRSEDDAKRCFKVGKD